MRNCFLLVLALTVICPCEVVATEPTFVAQVNALWKSKNYSQILQLATTETAKQPPPSEAYVILFGYHLFIAANHELAVQALNSLLARLENSDADAFQAVIAFKNDFLQIPSDEMQPPTSEELDGLHQMFPDDFPVQSLLLSISQQE